MSETTNDQPHKRSPVTEHTAHFEFRGAGGGMHKGRFFLDTRGNGSVALAQYGTDDRDMVRVPLQTFIEIAANAEAYFADMQRRLG